MYRKFKKANSSGTKDKVDHHGDADCTAQESLRNIDPEVVKQVADCWKTIRQFCSQSFDKAASSIDHKSSAATLGEWRTIRIFVSSTFMDFFSEREVLVKKVFPELREWCLERKLKLVECDLRWGVPKDATSTQALLTCLEELDRCYEANGFPFFLNMMGERYGWIPTANDIPEELHEKYNWVDGTSITFMEILHGAFRKANPNAAFFMRDPNFLSQLPSDHISRFEEKGALPKEHLRVLKSYLLEHFHKQTFFYSPAYGGVISTTGREMVELTQLDEFALNVIAFYKTAIEKMYPLETRVNELTPEERETELQWLFIQDKSEVMIGRDREFQLLMDYSCGASNADMKKIDGKNASIRNSEEWDSEEGDNQLYIVVADGGWGKTALLARLTQQAVQNGLNVFFHFVGSTANSKLHNNLLYRLLLALTSDPSDQEILDSATDTDAQKTLLRKQLAAWRDTKKQMLLVLDGLNELDSSEITSHLSWLPPKLPPGLRCVVSCNAVHLPTTSRLYEHDAFHLTLTALDAAALKELAINYFGRFGKRLDGEQLQQLVEKTKVNNPMWLTWMCEEFRVFGDFRMVDVKLAELPDSMDAFLSIVIKRLLNEDDSGFMKKSLCLTACSRNGLPVDFILRVMGDISDKVECPPLHWAQARRTLKAYSRTIYGSNSSDEFFTFIHESMWKAVNKSLLETEDDYVLWHTKLADFYQYWCDNTSLRVNELAYHLHEAKLKQRLIDFLKLDVDAAHIPAIVRSRYLNELRCRHPCGEQMPNTKEVVICIFCTNRQGGYQAGVNYPNKWCCMQCGNFCSPNISSPARICSFHAMRDRLGPKMLSCCVCNRTVFKQGAGPPQSEPAQLCQFCSFGVFKNTCAQFQV